jgi:hypothetical protein
MSGLQLLSCCGGGGGIQVVVASEQTDMVATALSHSAADGAAVGGLGAGACGGWVGGCVCVGGCPRWWMGRDLGCEVRIDWLRLVMTGCYDTRGEDYFFHTPQTHHKP